MGESSRPRTRLSRDRRVDSTLPPPREEAPLRRTSPRIPGAARVPRSSGRLSAPDESPPPPHEELVAENARLKRERAEDADEIAQMLVRLAEAERALLDAEAARDEALRQAAASEERLAAALHAMAAARELLDELQRREEIATGLRMRAIEETRQAVAGEPEAEPVQT
ncbi:MAG TPA: hypothetical protein VKU41_16415 [Polyangiaceae bacterium]|nr:hypothetical protein [Polyangiaceae bacterium]